MTDNWGFYMFLQGNDQKIEEKVKPVLFLQYLSHYYIIIICT